jgi:hypothetical protein
MRPERFAEPIPRRPIRYTANSVPRTLALLLSSLTLVACVSQPDLYAPPAQRQPLDQETLVSMQPMIEMGDPNIDSQIAADIMRGPQTQPWRWTMQRPAIKVRLKSARNFRYHIDFALPDVTFKETGPVTITFFVNGQKLDSVRYDTPGQKSFEKPVPDGILKEMSENILAAEIDKVWISPDKTPLGFIVSRFGLLQ